MCLWTLQEQVTVRFHFSGFFGAKGFFFVGFFSYGGVPCILLAWYEICFYF